MTVVAVCTAAGSTGSTTSSVLLGAAAPADVRTLVAECDPSGGDVAAWAQLGVAPGWLTAVAAADRTWPGLVAHTQQLPSGLSVLLAPTRGTEARTTIGEATRGFAGLLTSLPDVVTIADCGRVGEAVPLWTARAQLTLLLLRQSPQSAPATVAVVDRTLEALELLRAASPRVGVVLIGGEPYPPREIEGALGVPLFGTLPDDRAGAGLVAGSWTLGRRAGRSPLARAAALLSQRVVASLPATHPTGPTTATDPPAEPAGDAVPPPPVIAGGLGMATPALAEPAPIDGRVR